MNVALVALQSPVAPPCCHSCDRTSVNESGRRRLSLVLKGCDDPIPGTGVADSDPDGGDRLLRCLLRDGDSSSYLDLLLCGFVGVKYDGSSSSDSVSDMEYCSSISKGHTHHNLDTHLCLSPARVPTLAM